jgi:Transposase DDE domain
MPFPAFWARLKPLVWFALRPRFASIWIAWGPATCADAWGSGTAVSRNVWSSCRICSRSGRRLLRIDRAAVKAEEHLDGKFLLRSSDPTLSAEDIALGYKQLLVIERAWRDMKTTLDLRPVHHRKEDRIRAHVLLCWLALLLIRIAENQADNTWRNLRDELQRMHLGTFAGPAGTSRQRTELTARERDILHALGVAQPPLFLHLDAADPGTAERRA